MLRYDGASQVTITAIVCAYNEARYLSGLPPFPAGPNAPARRNPRRQQRQHRRHRAPWRAAIPGVRVVDEPDKGLVVARETARRDAAGDILAYVDADCRAPLHVAGARRGAVCTRIPLWSAVTGPYRFYDWDLGRARADSRLRRRWSRRRPTSSCTT